MGEDYNEEDLRAMTIPDLKQILEYRGLVKSGNKATLINRILTSQTPREERTLKKKEERRERKEERKEEKRRTELPVEVISGEVTPPTEITPKISPKLPVYEVQPDSTFINSQRDPDLVLGDIDWIISDYPRTRNQEVEMGKVLNVDRPYLGYIGGRKLFELPKSQLDNIVFHRLVAITVPQLEKDEKNNKYFVDYDNVKTFTLKPNTQSGSTLGYVLESIYRQIFKIPRDEELRDVKDIYGSVDIKYPFFEGLEKPTKESPSYKVLFGDSGEE
jgi:hypothetical protein